MLLITELPPAGITSREEDEPCTLGYHGSSADREGAPTPRRSRIQSIAPVQEQNASIPMWQAAFIDGALGRGRLLGWPRSRALS